MLGSFLFFACNRSDSAVEKLNTERNGISKQVAPQKVDVALLAPNIIKLEEVSNEKLEPLLADILGRELTEIERVKLIPIVQLMRSSCSLIWDKKGSLAQGILISDCRDESNDIVFIKQISVALQETFEAESDKTVAGIIESLALIGPYFKERDHDQIIEIWLSAEKPFLREVMIRVLKVEAELFHFYFYGEQEHPQLGSSFLLKLDADNRQKLSDWLASDAKIEQFVYMIEKIEKSREISLQQNQKEAERFGVRSSPTWFVNGYRLRGLQSVRQIDRFYRYP